MSLLYCFTRQCAGLGSKKTLLFLPHRLQSKTIHLVRNRGREGSTEFEISSFEEKCEKGARRWWEYTRV